MFYPGVGSVAPRAYWKGYLKLSLVSCPIALSPAASSSERISFRQINKKTGNRLKQQPIDTLIDIFDRRQVDFANPAGEQLVIGREPVRKSVGEKQVRLRGSTHETAANILLTHALSL